MTNPHRRDFLRLSAAALAALALPAGLAATAATPVVPNGTHYAMGFCSRPGRLQGYLVCRENRQWWLPGLPGEEPEPVDLRDAEVVARVCEADGRTGAGGWVETADGVRTAFEAAT